MSSPAGSVAAPATGPDAGPPSGLPGLDPRWSRHVRVPDADGVPRRWHLLDNGPVLAGPPVGTIVAVHGNPTWSYLWRHLLAAATTAGWRVVAVDQLEMGWSERTGRFRRLGERVDDLCRLTDTLDLDGPLVSIGHDWGGAISLGWAARQRDRLAGVLVTNTAVHQPEGSPIPGLIALAGASGVRWPATTGSTTFLQCTMATAHPWLPKPVRDAYLSPYRSVARRKAIGQFVADIPLDPGHPSWPARLALLEAVDSLRDVPALLLWGPRDPVFNELYLRDLRARLPHAQVHRFEQAGHLLHEDADVAGAALGWLADQGLGRPAGQEATVTVVDVPQPAAAAADDDPHRPLWHGLDARAGDPGPAIVEVTGGAARSVSWADLAERVREVAAGLAGAGVRPGDRVALLVPPGRDLTVAIYACLRIGAVIVVADAGLGLRGMHRALKAAAAQHLIGIDRALLAGRALRWAPHRIATGRAGGVRGRAQDRLLTAGHTLAGLAAAGRSSLRRGVPLPAEPGPDDEAAVVFTSGSTGPAKGVVYRHRQLAAAREALLATFPVREGDHLVAAFAPFALFGPALGVTSAVPDMDVTAPRTLTATALADAAAAVGATAVFASPAALANVIRTGAELPAAGRRALAGIRLLISAGAPVPPATLTDVLRLMPAATAHTPYGMTEVLPVTDVTLEQVLAAGPGDGVLVGHPVPGVELAIAPLGPDGRATGEPTAKPEQTGEILVRAAHVKDRYDQLWWTERNARLAPGRELPGWHRTGDVGHLDAEGRLWVEGRLAHVLTTPDGVLTPVGVEQRAETVPTVRRAAVVGVGPAGRQQVVVVAETEPAAPRAGLAPAVLAEEVRARAGVPVAAVLVVPALPTDIRHNAKIDRVAVGRWADPVLAGRRSRLGRGRW